MAFYYFMTGVGLFAIGIVVFVTIYEHNRSKQLESE